MAISDPISGYRLVNHTTHVYRTSSYILMSVKKRALRIGLEDDTAKWRVQL